MANRYTLWIVSPPDLIWSHVFDEVAIGLQSAFLKLGYKAEIVTDPRQIEGVPIVMGANLCPMYDIPLPDNAIIYNLEQVHADSRWFQKDYGYIDLLKKYPVWDYSKKNIEALKAFGIDEAIYCGVGYAPELTRIRRTKEDIDVVFVGGNHPRRTVIFDGITKGGARLHQVYKVFGQERDEWIARGKIHLNLHKETAQLFEIVRASYLLANHCFIISETSQDHEMMERFKEGIVFCPYEELVEKCLYYLVHPKKRKAIAEAGFELFKKMPQSDYLAAALEGQVKLDFRRHTKPAQTASNKPAIFVAMASYRDLETQSTIQDLFAKAAFPDRVHVGVCLQVDPEEDKDCMVSPALRPGQVRIRQCHYSESKGANWARDQTMQLMENEPYVLMIDSHMRFVAGWDEALLEMLAALPAEKPVLSGYVPDYRPPDQRARHDHHLLRIRMQPLKGDDDPRLLHLSGILVPLSDERTQVYYPSPFCIANFIFAPASTFKEVPIDPHIHFWGDEINFAARLWTHGYDIFQPNRVVLYHHWVRKDRFHLHGYRQPFSQENARSAQRIRHIIGLETAKDPLALVDIERYGLGKQRVLQDLWDFAGVDLKEQKLTDNAQQGIWNMSTREMGREAGRAGTDIVVQDGKSLPRIFVQIASYRDPDCQNTVKDLFEKANHPERIFVGIVWQFVKEEDAICFKVPSPYPKQTRIKEVDARHSLGVCWARSQVQQLWHGEEFTMQIDSHMRFAQGWDDKFLSMWKDCGSDKAVLTCYPPGFTPPDRFDQKYFFGMSAKEFDSNGIFLMVGAPAFEVGKEPKRPIPGAFASANCIFGPSSMIVDVPYDPHLYFFGEEILMAVRLWTSGYDLFHPNYMVIHHDWDRSKRPTHFSDFDHWEVTNERSFARVRHLLGTEISTDPKVLPEIEKYGLGKVRTLEEYQLFSGVNFAKKTIGDSARRGIFSVYYEVGKGTSKTELPPAQGEHLSGSTQVHRDGKIFVNIASYRDPECQWTVRDLFEKAKYPDRINVGICWQFDPIEDRHCFEVTTRPEQVRIMPVNWREAEGVCWARYYAQQLWEGEEYTLMIDSHMRFMQDWDEMMIAELAACDSPKPVLSCSPARYTPPNNLEKDTPATIRRVRPFDKEGNLRCQGEVIKRSPPKPLKGAFVVANFIFSRSEITPEVPYDPYLYFDQEEIMYAIRLFTHGWDVFSTRQQFLYHYYNDNNAPTGSVRPLHWRDLHKEDAPRIAYLRDRGLRRFNHMTGYEFSHDPYATMQLAEFGFGRQRSLAQFEAFTGIDFKKKVASEKALRGGFIENLNLYRDHPIYVPQLDDKKAGAVPPAVTPPPQQAILSAAKAISMIETGDYFPQVEVSDTNKMSRAIESFGGKFILAGYLPSDQLEFLALFFRELSKNLIATEMNMDDIHLLFVLDATMERLEELRLQLQIAPILYADPNRAIAHSFGIARGPDAFAPVGFTVNPNFKILSRHITTEPAKLAVALVNDCIAEMNKHRQKSTPPKIITESAPAVIVLDALSPELCAKCIQAFRNGPTFDGTVGANENRAYRADVKVRTDFIVEGELLAELDEKLSRSFLPELKKIFGFEVTHRERYKIGMYPGEKKGFFKQHRDNFDGPMGYRRIAATIHLNDDYEGGGLRFPEYDEHIYRPVTGSGIAFSCNTLHEARHVTKGERFILVCFFHGEQDEVYRRHYAQSKGFPTNSNDFIMTRRHYPGVQLSREFYDKWTKENVNYDAKAAPPPPTTLISGGRIASPGVLVKTIGEHKPKKVFESSQAIVFDDFLPENIYESVSNHTLMTDYERINASGKSVRAWHVHDGFPLRTSRNIFYNANGHYDHVGSDIYPAQVPYDQFIEYMLSIQPQVEHMIGKQSDEWAHFSVTGWMYPPGTGLSMHDDGSGVYTGAYVYFLNQTWRPHWGGLLLLADGEANKTIHDYRNSVDQIDYYKRKWLHANPLDEMLMENGFAQCIFPKRNRIVFIANDAYHMVTRVNEQCGDNLRMSLAGFFNKKKK